MLPRNPAQGRQRAKRGERKRGEVIGSYFYWLFVDGDDGRLHGAADAGRKRTKFGPGSDQVSSPEKSAKRCPGRALPDDGVESETGSLHKKFYAMRINRFKMLRRKRATTSLAARAACFAAAAAM
jgi:hypothetical protein